MRWSNVLDSSHRASLVIPQIPARSIYKLNSILEAVVVIIDLKHTIANEAYGLHTCDN